MTPEQAIQQIKDVIQQNPDKTKEELFDIIAHILNQVE